MLNKKSYEERKVCIEIHVLVDGIEITPNMLMQRAIVTSLPSGTMPMHSTCRYRICTAHTGCIQ